MKKTTIILMAMALMTTLAVSAAARVKVKATCTVKAIQEQNIILDCGEKELKLKEGDRVKLSKKTNLEGC